MKKKMWIWKGKEKNNMNGMNMSMTENEEKLFNKLMEHNSAYYGYELSKGEIKTVLQALEQLKQYKEIGTVQGYERAIQCSLENYNLYKEYKSKVQDYEAIGTVEELKALRSNDFTEDLLNVGFTKGYNKAIDEFTERLKDKLQAMADEPAYQHTGEDYFTGICCAETVVDEIAEKLLKSDEFILENIDLDERE